MAAEFKLMITLVCPAAARVPLLEETLSQADVLITDQLKAPSPMLARLIFCDAGLKGPPITPVIFELTE